MARKTPYTNFHDLNLDWIIKRIKNVYNDENPPPYPVKSVNGQTGNVHLTGDDVTVSPNNNTPISTELAGKYTKPSGGIPASDLAPGVIPDPTSVIDDNAGAGVYNKTWSAHKLFQLEAETVDLENDKQDAPASAGTAGQVLGLNSNLDPIWVTPSSGDVEDVRISGTSIVNQGIANIPLLDTGIFGLLTAMESYGLSVITAGILGLSKATDLQIKQGSHNYKPIVPANQDKAVFYGLAKAAGIDLAASSVTFGTYPDSVINAILTMLGVYTKILAPSGNTHTLLPCPNTYAFGEKSELTITVTANSEYYFSFSSPAGTACNLSILGITGTAGDTVEAGKYYEVSVWNGIAYIKNVVVTVG